MCIRGLVSVITPTYNCAKFIAETIESVQNQSYENWEMIIVDDCSQDDTRTIVRNYLQKDNRIKYYCLEKNSGAAIARTKAMELANGQYIAFLDSDDLWLPDKLEKQINFMEKNKYYFTSTSYQQMTEDGHDTTKILHAIPKTDYNRLLLDCPVGNSTVMYDVSKMGKFQVPNIRKRNDDALWLAMLKKENIYGFPEILMKYRLRKNSISSNKISLLKYTWILYRDIEHLSIFTSIWHICWWGIIKIFHLK
ncbi:teichuronic acid biosynthesis glycosyltransferase TuaG [Selenomonas ruminantium]|uniref:Teichuronic acid biosynthesis glycosyltransferase TuaG n=1 Tax=Selenomonas ruminantium TaxID=971 RepID=A0A1I3FNA0_SELRU|nr:glycosyltransferase family 2 protein [Selenomonas ruminantium]SFI12644.1 teichuronic acid biosynthesis glycosyltransferase TuaG [Selenomonas ruminantium]